MSMLGWLRALLGKSRPAPNVAPRLAAPESPVHPRLSLDDAVHIAHALRTLPRFGLKPIWSGEDGVVERAAAIAAQWEGIIFSNEPTPGDWALIAMSAESPAFENAIFFQDHCFDGMTDTEMADMIAGIAGIASLDWPVTGVEVVGGGSGAELKMGADVVVDIVAAHPVPRFHVTHDKDFDWSLIVRLNERLPADVTRRFAVFLDGNATIVFLEPGEIAKLSDYCGYAFVSEE